ncbi:hypothetical protein SEA_REFUGE_8 [Mycobacterium phage Refuge]|uniref:Uncharacterized protein n=1 Tax=Mycobacterium phage Refuge TaxID=2517967 RepID=A0A482JGB2_9CAUD|nr:hypothetical protein KIV61_gp08 [Mycobacterium phage Refuge]QBP31031.1 hypothetical protein SEA_REFUGE_8 [Mycobacterium phage Refuge]
MACGVTTVQNSVTVTCDNAGTSTHAGNHSGLLPSSISVFGFTWNTSTRIHWKAGVTTAVKQKVATIGESDFV